MSGNTENIRLEELIRRKRKSVEYAFSLQKSMYSIFDPSKVISKETKPSNEHVKTLYSELRHLSKDSLVNEMKTGPDNPKKRLKLSHAAGTAKYGSPCLFQPVDTSGPVPGSRSVNSMSFILPSTLLDEHLSEMRGAKKWWISQYFRGREHSAERLNSLTGKGHMYKSKESSPKEESGDESGSDLGTETETDAGSGGSPLVVDK